MAASLSPKIEIYASLPLSVAHDGILDVHPDNWEWMHCLTIPLNSPILDISYKPFKWLRFAIGVVLGTQGDLGLYPDPGPPDAVPVEYDAALPAESIRLYYHTSTEEKRRMFPIDPDIMHARVHSGNSATRRVDFRDDVEARDRVCVLTREEAHDCEAAHLLPHSKGDDVCNTYFQFSELSSL